MMISIAWQQAAREPSAEAGQAQRITRRASSGSSISSGGTAITGQKTRNPLRRLLSPYLLCVKTKQELWQG